MSVPSDVINRSIIAQIDSDFWSIQKLHQDLMILQNQHSSTWISWVNVQMLSFMLSRGNVLVEPGTEISISVRFGRFFGMCSAPLAFFYRDWLKTRCMTC